MSAALLFQIIALPIVVVVALARPDFALSVVRPIDSALSALGRRRGVSIVVVAAMSMSINMSLGLFVHEPVPAIHDEFAYLLGADTFASGRLTNPPHPMWEHFESYHIIHQPTYQSKYPPGQSLFLALGQVVFGHPIWGVWISLALACGAVTWMLQAWLPPKWALIGGLIVVFNPLITLQWGQTYWGGAVAMLGGALLFGALRRILKHQRPRDAIILGIGLVLLAYTRPYEGLVASIPAAIMLFGWLFTARGPSLPQFLGRIAFPTALVLVIGMGWLALYHQRVTGHPLRMPYQVWGEQYGIRSTSRWLSGAFDDGNTESVGMRLFLPDHALEFNQGHFTARRERITSPAGKAINIVFFHLGILVITLPFALYRMKTSRWVTFGLITAGVTVLAVVSQSTIGNPHYAAPITGLIFYLAAMGLRQMSTITVSGRRLGLAHSYPLVAIYTAGALIAAVAGSTTRSDSGVGKFAQNRVLTERELQREPGKHLVTVRYGERHHFLTEWVYNAADIDASPVVWARDLGSEKNAALIEYFERQGRRVWLLEVETADSALSPYTLRNGSEAADDASASAEDAGAPNTNR